jgi:hypothetical protein
MAEIGGKIKVWKMTKNSPAGVMVTEDSAFLVGNKVNFVHASDIGVNISGRSISFQTGSENIRQGGLYINLPDPIKLIPQTLVTPAPTTIPFPPIAMVTNVVKDLPFFLAMLI